MSSLFGWARAAYDGYRHWWDVTIGELPWVKAAGIVTPLTGVVLYFNKQLPQELAVDLTNANLYVVFAASVFVVYFLLVAVFFQTRLNAERQLRRLEQNFRYDRRGTLYNGSQPNIAFRVPTFKGMLSSMTKHVNYQTLQHALLEAGGLAAIDFSKNLPSIYDGDIQSRRGGSVWKDLSFDEKLSHWMDYDSATGWGILSADREGEAVVIITVNHQKGLVEGAGGLLFGCFLGGYCRTVLSAVVAAHSRGALRDYSYATLTALTPKGEHAIEFRFTLS